MSDEPLVEVSRQIPEIVIDLRYATADNFTGKVLYPVSRCFLRASVVEILKGVQNDLRALGLRLKIWDAYRPHSVQKILWEIIPDERYIADPAKGSRHNRGAAIDATLVDKEGAELEMPSAFDDFSERAHRHLKMATPAAKANFKIFDEIMAAHGFTGLRTEWWHFDAPGWERFGVLDVGLESLK